MLMFRRSWPLTTALFGALASTLGLTALLFRYIGRDAVQGVGVCTAPVVEGGEVYCTLGVALARIGGGLGLLAIVVAGATFWAAWRWHLSSGAKAG